jgi:hypothetical protein
MTRITGTFFKDVGTFMMISCWILLRMRDVSDKSCIEIKTHILCSIIFSGKSCNWWDNVEKYCRAGQATDDNVLCHMGFAWMTKATNTHSEYLILIAFPQQQCLCQLSSALHSCVHCLSC